ncbi:hypothetical protein HK098_005213, partial [Nowakowskiella sp. JEL0407]
MVETRRTLQDIDKPSSESEEVQALNPKNGNTATSAATPAAKELSALQRLGFLDRFLALWIILAMTLGLLLGYFTDTDKKLQSGEFVGVSIPIAVGLLIMMYPILCKVLYKSLHQLFEARTLYIHISFSVFVNWIISPLLMITLAWGCLPDQPELREGLILVGIARCIAMVLIWTDLAGGDTNYCAMLVALNSMLQMILFAPFALLYINIMSRGSASGGIEISYTLVAKSVAVFLGIPLGAAIITRFGVVAIIGKEKYDKVFMKFLGPSSLIGLLFTIVVLFANQSKNVVVNIISVLRVSVPLLLYFVIVFFGTLMLCRYLGGWRSSADVEGGENEKMILWRSVWGYGKSVTQ